MPKRAQVKGKAKLYLTINGKLYSVYPLDADPAVARVAWRLQKTDGTSYDVCVDEFGARCECPDYSYARDGIDRKGCKHIAGMRAVGLLPQLAGRATV